MIDRSVALAATGFVISGQHRDAFKQRGFTRAVLAGDDGDRPVEIQVKAVAQERQAERIGLAVCDLGRIEPDPPEIRRGKIDRTVSF